MNAFKYEIETDPKCEEVTVVWVDKEGLSNPERYTYQIEYTIGLDWKTVTIEK